MLLLTNDDVARVLTVESAMTSLRRLFEAPADTILNRPRTESSLPHPDTNCQYRCKTMEGGATYLGAHVLRAVSSVDEEAQIDGRRHTIRRPLPEGGWVGMLLVFDTSTGELIGMMPDGYLQRTRVGALYALVAERLARGDAAEVGLIGSGWQAGAQLAGIAAVRSIRRIRVFSPNSERRRTFAEQTASELRLPVEAVDNAHAAVDGADIVILATNSSRPVLEASWVQAGQHVSSVREPELDPQLFDTADRVIVNTAEQWRLDCGPGMLRARERTRTPAESSGRRRGRPVEVEAHEFFAGTGSRADANEITLFWDEPSNFRIGAQFAAVACEVLHRARQTRLGQELPRDWFVQNLRP